MQGLSGKTLSRRLPGEGTGRVVWVGGIRDPADSRGGRFSAGGVFAKLPGVGRIGSAVHCGTRSQACCIDGSCGKPHARAAVRHETATPGGKFHENESTGCGAGAPRGPRIAACRARAGPVDAWPWFGPARRLAVIGGLLAGLLAFAIGEATYGTSPPRRFSKTSWGPRSGSPIRRPRRRPPGGTGR